MEKPFSSASKITAAEQEKRWGKQYGKLICVLVSGNNWASVGCTQPARVMLFFWSERKQKACVSFTGSVIFLPYTHSFMANLFPCISSSSNIGSSAAQPEALQLHVAGLHFQAQHDAVQGQHLLSSALEMWESLEEKNKSALAEGCSAQIHHICHLN